MPNLVGTGLNQVPSNSMLGGLAYQDPEHASIKDLDLKNLSQINSEISDTASDVFVYDTRKDSDGGAWRKRTQHTSWYNETLGTSTRGTRREFPAVAVIVAERNFIKIYDGDDPDLPMWMIFNVGSQGMANTPMVQLQNVDKVVYALNGILATGTKNESSNYGQPVINFISEKVLRMDSQGGEGGEWMGNIAQRNEAIGYRSVDYDYVIASSRVNDVAMTVLPNAPIDDATGLPVPTIAVAQSTGISIIMDDGNVISSTSNSSYPIYEISILPSGELYHRQGSGSNEGVCFNYPYTRIKNINLGTYANSSTFWYGTDDVGNSSSYLGFNTVAPNAIIAPDYKSLNIGDNKGLTFVDVNKESLNHGMSAFTASNYSTGWMHGDIKGAFLSDTDTTNITGTSLIANGDFSSNSTAAFTTVAGGTAEVTGGLLKLTDTGGTFVYASAPFTTVIGNQYFVTVDIVNNSNTAPSNYIRCGNSHNATQFHNTNYGTSYGTKTFYFTATATTTYLTLISGHGAGNPFGHWDNIFVYKLDNDRSVNSKGLQVYGTVPKQVVATGADLVSYGPFNNNNNFRQPYNSDLTFVQNDFSIMFWVYDTGVNQHCTLVSRDEREFDISRLAAAYGWKLRIYTRNFNGDLRAPDSSSALPQNRWTCVCVVYTEGKEKRVYINGVLDRLITGTDGEYEIDSTTYGLNIGVRYTGGTKNYSADGVQLALLRIGSGAPSAEQVRKIYDDEKQLFVENAKATLYGSSDVVTALGHDDSSNILHVGTSAGRSEFQGLRRINNTTTAVTTAISASNGLVAEQ